MDQKPSTLPSAPPAFNYDNPPPYSGQGSAYPMLPTTVSTNMMPQPLGDNAYYPYTNTNTNTNHSIPAANATYGPFSIFVKCPGCNESINTKITHRVGAVSWLSCLACCLCLCWPCSILPFCMDCSRNIEHSCPKCNRKLGMYRKIC